MNKESELIARSWIGALLAVFEMFYLKFHENDIDVSVAISLWRYKDLSMVDLAVTYTVVSKPM